MKQVLTKILLGAALITMANAGDKFNDLSEEYLYGNISSDVRKEIAKDPQTATKILKILAQDTNAEIRKYAKDNLN